MTNIISPGDSSISLNEIEWILDGERASSYNLNRALKQYLSKNNEVLEVLVQTINEHTLSLGSGTVTPLEKIDDTDTDINIGLLGHYVIRDINISVDGGLPIGWNCLILANENIVIDLKNENVFGTGDSTFSITKDKTVKITKVTSNRWSVKSVTI